MDVYYTLYSSSAKQSPEPASINDILSVSQTNNHSNGVTGFLYHEKSVFLQYLEGQKSAVWETMNRIKKDSRHSDLKLLSSGVAGHRYFSGWNMGFVQDRIVPLSELINLENGPSELEQFDPIDLLVFLSSNNALISPQAA